MGPVKPALVFMVACFVITIALTLVAVRRSAGTTSVARTDSVGDPYVSPGQEELIRVGMGAQSAFGLLGGRSLSGYNGVQAGPVRSYDYPIRGTGTGDAADVSNGTYTWFEVCVRGGRVVGTYRGHLDALPLAC